MDPLSHAILGRMVTRAAARTATRGVAAASILGALSPDVDFVLMPAGWDVYLRAHEIGTHSIPGLIVTGLGSAVLVRLAVRGSRFATLPAPARGSVPRGQSRMSSRHCRSSPWPIPG